MLKIKRATWQIPLFLWLALTEHMYYLLKKEISSFFSSLTGYIVIIVFLITNSLFMWILPGNANILESGYANIDPLFVMAPWVFLFLVPAVTMRLFAEEKKSGTMELLLTRPLSELKIILAKYFAGIVLVMMSLIPTLVYFFAVYYLGNPVGNIDTGGTWGSYLGLLFLAGIYVSIGVFASSLTSNQIVAFILAVFLSFLFYIGFESFATAFTGGFTEALLVNIGINEHYISMSRGVIDFRDAVYFLSIITAFVFFTKVVLESRKW